MAAQIESITPQEGFLEVTLRGVSEPDDFEDFLPTVRSALKDHNLRAALIDCTNVVYSINVLLEHRFAVCLAEMFEPPIRFAFLAPWSAMSPRPHIETTALNRGVKFLVFREREDAVYWLRPE